MKQRNKRGIKARSLACNTCGVGGCTIKLYFLQLELCLMRCKFHGTMSSWNNTFASMKYKPWKMKPMTKINDINNHTILKLALVTSKKMYQTNSIKILCKFLIFTLVNLTTCKKKKIFHSFCLTFLVEQAIKTTNCNLP